MVILCFLETFGVKIKNNNDNKRFVMRRKMPKQTQRRRSLHIGKTHDQHIEACCRGISFCLAGDSLETPIESSALLPIPQWC